MAIVLIRFLMRGVTIPKTTGIPGHLTKQIGGLNIIVTQGSLTQMQD